MYIQIYCFIIAFTHSIWPSVSGQYTIDNSALIQSQVVSSFQNIKTNWLLLSEMIVLGSPQSFYIWSRNSWVMAGVDISGQAIRCLILDNQSITTIMFIQPLLTGRLIIKSIKIFFYFQSRVGSGFNRLLYILYKALACWQIQQLKIYFYIILYIFGQ